MTSRILVPLVVGVIVLAAFAAAQGLTSRPTVTPMDTGRDVGTERPSPSVEVAATISAFAGTGSEGFSGDGGPAKAAQLYLPAGLAFDASGALYIADLLNNRVRKVSPDGTITTVAGKGTKAFSGDGGLATAGSLNHPHSLAVDASGALYIADLGNHRVRKVSPDGTITTVAGTGNEGFSGDGGPATAAQLSLPAGLAVDASGALYIADLLNNRVRKVSPDGTIATVAGMGNEGFSGDGGPATAASLNRPASLAVDASGALYIADSVNHRVRKVSPDGSITTVAGAGNDGFSGDGGPATAAQLHFPASLAVDASGALYIAGSVNHRVRKVSPNGTITTVAETGARPATLAWIHVPPGLAVDASGALYIADRYNHLVRRVAPRLGES